MEVNEMTLIQKLAKIRSMSDVVTKDKSGYNYKYADITAILANITSGMKKYNVSLIPSFVPGTFTVNQNVLHATKFTKTGSPYEQTTTEMIVRAEMVFKWVNDDNPEDFIIVPWVMTGSQTDPSQAVGSGLTYCTRYFLTNYFQIAQPETDVDAYRIKQKAAEEAESKAIAAEIINQFDTVLKEFLAEHSDKTEEVKTFISKYVKNSNYPSIKDPAIASKLFTDFKNAYIEKGE